LAASSLDLLIVASAGFASHERSHTDYLARHNTTTATARELAAGSMKSWFDE
jgi:hypothetical protein